MANSEVLAVVVLEPEEKFLYLVDVHTVAELDLLLAARRDLLYADP